jgi:hypothetical protein
VGFNSLFVLFGSGISALNLSSLVLLLLLAQFLSLVGIFAVSVGLGLVGSSLSHGSSGWGFSLLLIVSLRSRISTLRFL